MGEAVGGRGGFPVWEEGAGPGHRAPVLRAAGADWGRAEAEAPPAVTEPEPPGPPGPAVPVPPGVVPPKLEALERPAAILIISK